MTRPYATLAKYCRLLFESAAGGAACIVLFCMTMFTFVDVIGRYFFNAPIPAAYEVVQIMMGVLTFAALPLVTKKGEHITISLFDSLFPQGMKRILRATMGAFCSVMLAFLAWRVGLLALETASYGDTTQQANIPLAPFRFFIAGMLGVSSIVALSTSWRALRVPE